MAAIIPGQDAASDARAAGYDWEAINGHVDDATQTAQAAGYTQQEIDTHLGYRGTDALQGRLAVAAGVDPALNVVRPLGEPKTFGGKPDIPEAGSSINTLTPDIARHYADAVANGEVKNPNDFAQTYLDAMGVADPAHRSVAGADIVGQLPTIEDVTDHALAIAYGNGDNLDRDTMRDARTNLLDLWSSTGTTPAQVLDQHDPVIHDAVTQPGAFHPPTMEELKQQGRDAIEAKFPFVPFVGNMTSDPTGVVGIAKSLMNLPKAEAENWEKLWTMAGAGESGGALFNQFMEDPVLKTIAGAVVPGLAGAGAEMALSRVAQLPFGALLKNEEGAVHINVTRDAEGRRVINIGKGAKPETGAAAPVEAGAAAPVEAGFTEPSPSVAAGDVRLFHTGKMDKPGSMPYVTENYDLSSAYSRPGAKTYYVDLAKDHPLLQNGTTFQAPTELAKSFKEFVAQPEPIKPNLGPDKPTAPEDKPVMPRILQSVPESEVPSYERHGKIVETTGLEDDIHRLQTNRSADRNELTMSAAELPEQMRTVEFQKKVQQEINEKLAEPLNGSKPHEFSPEVDEYLRLVKPMEDVQKAEADTLIDRLKNNPDENAELADVATSREGYAHRVYDREKPGEQEADPIIGRGPTGLGKFASSVQNRNFFVAENPVTGQRTWMPRTLKEAGVKYGDRINTNGEKLEPINDRGQYRAGSYVARQATDTEIEKNTGHTIRQNHLLNMLGNIDRLRVVNRNLDLTDKHIDVMAERGLYVKETPDNVRAPPSGMERVDVPQIRGWADPKIARTLNDLYSIHHDSLLDFLENANGFLTRSLFITPFGHIWNVATGYGMNRGWDWLNPLGYGRMTRSLMRAYQDVTNFANGKPAPDYMMRMREGTGFQFPNTQVQNWHAVVMQRVFNEVAQNSHLWGDYVKSVMGPGYAASDLVSAMYKGSHETLWKSGDMLLLARMYELEGQGLSIRQARIRAEADIFNYRVPTVVAERLLGVNGGNILSNFMKRPLVQVFGRYHYGVARSLSQNFNNTFSPHATAQQRIDALGKWTALGLMAGLHALTNWGLRQIPGNEKQLIGAPWSGQLGWLHNFYGLTTGQKDWLGFTGKLISLGSVWGLLEHAATNRDQFGNQVVNPHGHLPAQAVELAGGAASQFPVSSYGVDVLKEGGLMRVLGRLLGMEVHTPVDEREQAYWDRRDTKSAYRAEARGPITSWADRMFGVGQAASPDLHPNLPMLPR